MLLIQCRCDLPAADPIQSHGKDPADDGGNLFVYDDLVLFGGVHLIAIHGLASDELPLALLIPLHGLDLLGNVLGVHIIHNGTKRGLFF